MNPEETSSWQSFGTFARTERAFVLSVLTKRSYRWDVRGAVTPLDEQLPVTLDVVHETRDDRNGELVVQGRDAWPLKLATDVIVTGHARTRGGVAARELAVSVSVGSVRRDVVALGPRFVQYRGPGDLRFSSPELFTEVELSFWNAYGGMDPLVLPRGIRDTPAFAGKPILELFPGAYPRNPCGLGYLIEETPALLDGLALPLLEDPHQRLTPDTFLTRDPRAWGQQPRPAAFGWCHPLWFPRIVHAGGKPYHLPVARPGKRWLPELELGQVDEAQLTDSSSRHAGLRCAQEAVPDLILPFLNGSEAIALSGFDVLGDQAFRLPGERPMVHARVDAELLEPLASVLHTVAIDADKKEFYVLYSTRFALPEGFSADLSDGTPIDELVARCDVTVAGRSLERAHWPNPPKPPGEDEPA